MISQYCIYRYLDRKSKDVLYVGKTDACLDNRINAHKTEEKFKDIDAIIEFMELDNNMETRFLEFYFINKWKPALNELDKYEEILKYNIDFEFKWVPYIPEKQRIHEEEKATKQLRWVEFLEKTQMKNNTQHNGQN